MLCKAAYGLLDPDELSVSVNRQPYVRYLGEEQTRRVAASSFFVFQEPSSHLNPLMRITEQLREGSLSKAGDESTILQRLWETIDRDSLSRLLEVYPKPYRPSGGEKQRILLAMAFKKIDVFQGQSTARPPTFFVFDEPTGSLDDTYRNRFLALLFEKYALKPFTTMFITHDYSIISEVYARYRALLPRIHFKELSRLGDGNVAVRDFSTEEYLGWLRSVSPPGAVKAGATPALSVAPVFRVFDRTLSIYADEAHTKAAPLMIRPGEMVYVKAPSGVGKTTLAKLIMGLYSAQEFAMTLAGESITHHTPRTFWHRKVWGRSATMVFQHADEALNLEATVRETFDGLALEKRLSAKELKARLLELFEGPIPDSFLKKKVKYLSGGQKQRLNLLRSLILGTDLLILDEPLNALDFGSVKKVLALLDEKRRKGTALLMISHNEEIFDTMVGEEHVYHLAEVRTRS